MKENLILTLRLAGALRSNESAMAEALRGVMVEDAEVGSVLSRSPTQIARWMIANNDRQISFRHFWKLAERANAVAFDL